MKREYEVKSAEQKPPRSPNLPTEAERLAAVKGKLEPRTVKGKKSQTDLARTGVNDMPVGHPLGVTTGLPVYMAICYMFQQNERAKRQRDLGNDKAEVLTDKQLSAWLKSEFPGRKASYWDKVQFLRYNYNHGFFTQKVTPEVVSHRYDSGGQCIDPVYRREK